MANPGRGHSLPLTGVDEYEAEQEDFLVLARRAVLMSAMFMAQFDFFAIARRDS